MNNVKKFVAQWSSRGYEKGETQPFWLALLRDVFGVSEPEKFISFEVPVPHGFIDALLINTKVLIEQKSSAVNLDDAEIFLQAKRYNDALEFSRKARWIITCNFREFRVFDMDKRRPELEPIKIFLFELPKKFSALNFLVELKDKISVERELSIKAGAIVAKIYDGLRGELKIQNPDALSDLNKLCVRLVFCLYAESIDIFGKHKMFRDYLRGARNIRQDLLELFKVLDTPLESRSPYLDDTLKKFPYVDGGLFKDDIDFPNFTPEIKKLLLDEASSSFDWSQISPAIFGTVFESTLEDEPRRAGGMHYTSTENIHKVINPLFMDDLCAEFDTIKKTSRNRRKNLLALQDKLATLKILDPACGSGNFLTETYISLRRLENEILKELLDNQIILGELDDPIKVSIQNFYGIELNNFAVTVAQTALWIAELMMKRETEEIVHKPLDLFPLKTEAHILEANALHVDWATVAHEVNYIISNPPFVGRRYRSAQQQTDVARFFDYKDVDYVACWYYKAAKLIHGTDIKAAFVSTNSITQGEQVAPLWKKIFDEYHMQIIFAYRTFKWDSESAQKAAVHCVIIGMADRAQHIDKKIFDGEKIFNASNINPYLVDAPTIFVESRSKHFQADVPLMCNGNVPLDGNALKIEAADYENFIRREPSAKKFIKRLIGGRELLYNEQRYVLWLVDCPPNELRKLPLVMERIKLCRENRLAMKDKSTRKLADTPTTFRDTLNPAHYIALPMVSSERRQYIPMNYFDGNTIPTNQVQIIPGATLYHFGVLTSSIHMAWMRAVAGRLESRYRYSKDVVYNNFPWCSPTDKQRALIESTAQKILDARKNYPSATLADLYDELTMPKDLRAAHKKNDRAVAQAYGLEKFLDDEPAIISELLKIIEGEKSHGTNR